MTLNKLAMHFGVGIAYAALYAVCRKASFAHWVPLAGLRITALMVSKYELWPTLGLSDSIMLFLSEMNFVYGLSPPIMFLSRMPPILVAMPFVAIYRKWTSPKIFSISGKWCGFIACAITVSAFFMFQALAAQYLIFNVYYSVEDFWKLACKYFVGLYIAILAIASPIFIVSSESCAMRTAGLDAWWVWNNKWVLELAIASASCIALATVVNSLNIEVIRWAAYIALLAPVVTLSLRNGCRGASVMCAASSVSFIIMMPHRSDVVTIIAQAALAFITSTLLIIGPKIAEDTISAEAIDPQGIGGAKTYLNEIKSWRDR